MRRNKLKLDREDTVIKSVKSIDLEGYDVLYDIACIAPNKTVQERASYLLALIHYLYMDGK
jgi:hypothetical protein